MRKLIFAPLLCMGAICAQAQSTGGLNSSPLSGNFTGWFGIDCSDELAGGTSLYNVVSGTLAYGFNNFLNNDISQLDFPPGFTVTLYDGAGASSAQGAYMDFTSVNNCLIGSGGFDNRASSFRATVNAQGNNVATFYTGIDYSGGNGVSLPVGTYTLSQLVALGFPNDALSSLTLRPGYGVRLYKDEFLLQSITYDKSRANLGSENFDNMTSAIEVVQLTPSGTVPPPSIVAIVYEDCQEYSGAKVYLTKGTYTKAQLTAMGMPDNSVSRFRLLPGYIIDLYDGNSFENGLLNFSNTFNTVYDGCIAGLGQILSVNNDKTSSLKIAQNPGYTPIAYNSPIDIGNKIQRAEINAYPNPAQDNITINNLQGSNDILIYNTVGQLVLSTTTKDTKANLDISALAKGYYHVKVIETASKVQTVLRIVKR